MNQFDCFYKHENYYKAMLEVLKKRTKYPISVNFTSYGIHDFIKYGKKSVLFDVLAYIDYNNEKIQGCSIVVSLPYNMNKDYLIKLLEKYSTDYLTIDFGIDESKHYKYFTTSNGDNFVGGMNLSVTKKMNDLMVYIKSKKLHNNLVRNCQDYGYESVMGDI